LARGPRRRGREAALQILYQLEMSGVSPAEAADLYWSHLAVGRPGEAAARSFSEHLVEVALRRRVEIDEAIRGVSDNWKLERMGSVDRNVLRLAVAELLEERETPAAVIIDEAIEVAKRFGGEESGQFVNGVLDALRCRLDEGRLAPAEPAPDD
jgi:N utilization substance protein B